ncbi:caspase family protein [Amycolatopsis sp. cmx-4-68]|uniref:caspase family protein n=1 Tax=Amycolatopsis sp. cmx-4-68 TaxID=2790938 RepID=UPI00397DCE06
MTTGLSIHIGLNRVDPDAYGGWAGELGGCENDANAMTTIATARGFSPTTLLNERATSDAVLAALDTVVDRLRAGDILLVTYAGHGGQLPDQDGDEPDARDETWCLYDRELLDDELAERWSRLARGVRCFVLSDSCHSGTITREPLYRQLGRLPEARDFGVPATPVLRGVPDAVQQEVLLQHGRLYRDIRRRTRRVGRDEIGACVLLISGCQDNQQSMDGAANGLFTEKLLQVWNGGGFSGDHARFHHRILDLMPPVQSPNYFVTGAADSAFEAQVPFTVASPESAEPEPVPATRLSVRAPGTVGRFGAPPVFEVEGAYRYRVLEVAVRGELFDWDAHGGERDGANFYATWDDPAVGRFEDDAFTLPAAVWERMRDADRLHYRVGTTSSPSGWADYTVSTRDDDGANAPFVTIADGDRRTTTPRGK